VRSVRCKEIRILVEFEDLGIWKFGDDHRVVNLADYQYNIINQPYKAYENKAQLTVNLLTTSLTIFGYHAIIHFDKQPKRFKYFSIYKWKMLLLKMLYPGCKPFSQFSRLTCSKKIIRVEKIN
jgi:hypothetical protein